ncbi:G5 domain-containing protein [uncultured Microbacterium sp.]|uniref:G5 domain-containing protein n=1 Tax=uncultured Microbacterium sp. TaxID=191216 RepID=UPI0025EEDD74|nr:G5 domain-containing protein [uncultured Microbacterium sp.]
MANAQPGWYPDPNKADTVRWWDGTAWTAHVAEKTGAAASADTAVTTAATPKGPRRGLSRRTSIIVGAAAVLGIALVGGAVNAATLAARSAAEQNGAVAFVAATGTAAASTPTPTPTHTPVVTTRDEAVTEVVPFERTSVDDSTMAQGQSAVTTAGQNGERTRTYRVTLTDGKETKRELVSDTVTVPPVTEVTSVGTYVEPAAPPPAAAPGGCDPNYADACVPIASDVDCAGGKGNGPAYFDGVARVVGRDIYKLDGDGDGWACNG